MDKPLVTTIVTLLIAFISSGQAYSSSIGKLSTTSDLVVGSQVLAKKKLASDLKDPDSAKYKDVHAYQDDAGGKTAIVFCGEINAKNSFGGYNGYERFVAAPAIAVMESEMTVRLKWTKFGTPFVPHQMISDRCGSDAESYPNT
ncbi:MAG: hypothetical protein ACRES9_05155 [Gammaproteobacteria bacterium]